MLILAKGGGHGSKGGGHSNHESVYGDQTADAVEEIRFIKNYMQEEMDEVRIGIGHQFEDLILECTFRGRDCRKDR